MKIVSNFKIVLVKPEIPQNTGNIGRICVSTNSTLHLIKPLGFSLEDKYVRRAGMDYWNHVDLNLHEDWDSFLPKCHAPEKMYFFSTKTERPFWDCPLESDSYLIFGNESSGFPPEFYSKYEDRTYTIPMPGKFFRSLNLANSVSVVLYEGLRRLYQGGN